LLFDSLVDLERNVHDLVEAQMLNEEYQEGQIQMAERNNNAEAADKNKRPANTRPPALPSVKIEAPC
jgi:hypothetical protein